MTTTATKAKPRRRAVSKPRATAPTATPPRAPSVDAATIEPPRERLGRILAHHQLDRYYYGPTWLALIVAASILHGDASASAAAVSEVADVIEALVPIHSRLASEAAPVERLCRLVRERRYDAVLKAAESFADYQAAYGDEFLVPLAAALTLYE